MAEVDNIQKIGISSNELHVGVDRKAAESNCCLALRVLTKIMVTTNCAKVLQKNDDI